MASISFASESLMDPRIQVKLDKYQKCGNITSQTSLLSGYTGSKAMMFVKLYFRTSDIYLISLVSLDPSGFHLRTK